MRLNRYLSASGYISRRKGEAVICDGRVTVNGVVVTNPAANIDIEDDAVTVDGKPLVINSEKRYYVMNKPMGVIVSMSDTHGRPTVHDIIGPEMKGVFPVGRLDADTTGVLIFTDDGDLAYRLTHPSFGAEKVYRAEVEGNVGKRDVQQFKEGLIVDGRLTAPAALVIHKSSEDGSHVEITIHEGRKRQIRHMLKLIGHPVRTLERISFGGVTADNLSRGTYRSLTVDEVERLKKKVFFTIHHSRKGKL